MGFNTTVVVMNDSLSAIRDDPDFGKNLYLAVVRVQRGEPVDVPALGHCNAATVIETHHADGCAVVTVAGNMGIAQHYAYGWDHHTADGALRVLRSWADALGYRLTKKRGV